MQRAGKVGATVAASQPKPEPKPAVAVTTPAPVAGGQRVGA
jgi:hypothetical protein